MPWAAPLRVVFPMTPSGRLCVVTGSPFRSALTARSTPLPAIVSPNLLKASTNSPVISVLWESVAEKLRLGLRIDAIRSQFAPNGVAFAARARIAGRADRKARGPLRAANQGRHGNRLGCAHRAMLGMPLRSGAAHIVQLRPIGVEHSFDQSPQEVGEVGGEPRSLAASSEHPNRGPCRDHDAVRSARCLCRLLHSLVGHRVERLGSMIDRPVALNLGKISRLRTAQSVVFLASAIRSSWRGGCDVGHIPLAFVIED